MPSSHSFSRRAGPASDVVETQSPSASGLGRTALFSVFYWALAILTIATSAKIALVTAFNAHPDEFVHIDAFCYFSRHWWPPELNSSAVLYSPQGWSRVYAGELVYLAYGSSARLIQPVVDIVRERGLQLGWFRAWDSGRTTSRAFLPFVSGAKECRSGLYIYRLLNVTLYAFTLGVLYYMGRKHLWIAMLGLLLMSVPQVTYVYSYANSDAWALSASLFLFLFALKHRFSLIGSWRNLLGLSLLTGLVVLAKQSFWVLLPFVYGFLGWSVMRETRHGSPPRPGELASSLTLLVATSLLVIAPLKIIYPLSQGDYDAGIEAMREARATESWKPSNPTSPGYRLASKGVPFQAILFYPGWLKNSAASFYGVFGYMTVASPRLAYVCAVLVALMSSLLTIIFVARHPGRVPSATKALLVLTPPTIALSVLASMYNSWTYDLQPQGRYLFPMLIPLSLLMASTIEFESRWLRVLRVVSTFFLFLLSVYVLWFVVLRSTVLL